MIRYREAGMACEVKRRSSRYRSRRLNSSCVAAVMTIPEYAIPRPHTEAVRTMTDLFSI